MSERMKFEIVGKSYGYVLGELRYFSDIKDNRNLPKYISCTSQHGWRDGCRESETVTIKNPVILLYSAGDAYSLGVCIIEGELLTDDDKLELKRLNHEAFERDKKLREEAIEKERVWKEEYAEQKRKEAEKIMRQQEVEQKKRQESQNAQLRAVSYTSRSPKGVATV